MQGVFNYEYNETLATGFVRPKVTALFFDKIWIPGSLLDSSYEFFAIPKEVLVVEKEETIIKNSFNKGAGLYYINGIDHNVPYKTSNIRSGDFYKIHVLRNSGVISSRERGEMDEIKFKYSKNRNHAILVSSENFNRKYGLHISPVFHNLTEFERNIQTLENEKLYKNNSLKFKLRKPNTFLNKDAISICIQDFPSIKEDELSWEQVLEIRRDTKRIQQLKRFTTWVNRFFVNKSPVEIREIFESELNSYKSTLKEHGVKTAIGAFSTIVSSTSSIASIIAKPDLFLLPMLSITAVSINFSINTYFANLKNRNNPIAYLYDIEN